MPADRLAAVRRGAGPTVVLVHGFTQTGRSWDQIAAGLAEHFTVVTVDAPGHGGSAAIRTDLVGAAELLGRVGGPATYVGYSMGGRLCLHLAVAHPELIERLVLVSTSAGIDHPGERAARRHADERLAESIEHDGVDAFLDRWVAQPLFATLDDHGLADRRRNSVAGLASSLRLAGTGTQEPLWGRLSTLTMPVLLIAGSLDAKFVAAAERMASLLPQATVVVVEGAGHTVHLERPDEFLSIVGTWLSGRDSRPDGGTGSDRVRS